MVRQRPSAIRMLDVAAAAGVSRSTVSLVMTDSPLVADDTRQKVLDHAARLGYVYNRGAANLRTHRSNVLGLVTPDIANPFVAEAISGIQDAVAPAGYFVVVSNTGDDAGRQRLVLRSLAEQRVDGVVLVPAVRTDPGEVQELVAMGLPIVLLTRDVEGSGLPYVGSHHEVIGELGLDHLVDVHGVGSAAYLGGTPDAAPRASRVEGFRRVAARRGVAIDEDWMVAFEPDSMIAADSVRQLLRRGAPPEALFCHSDVVAYGALRALAEHGIGVGECRVIGADNSPQSVVWNPSVSSVAVFPRDLGAIAGRMLLSDAIDGNRTYGDSAFVARESCGCVTPSVEPTPA